MTKNGKQNPRLHEIVDAKFKRPGDRHKYPDFWPDKEVRAAVIDLHREVEIAQARSIITQRFGETRAPSQTAIHRFWQRLDELRYWHVGAAAQAPDQRKSADFHALVAARIKQPGDGHKYPDFWADLDVRGALIDLHREVHIGRVRAILTERFGAARTPSKSAIHRFWQRLDELRYARAGGRR